MHTSNLNNIINILSDGKYHDGTSIGSALNITRSAVWKTIKKLQNYDIPINRTKGRGYIMSEPFIMLDKSEIQCDLRYKATVIDILESTDSTNKYLHQFYGTSKTRFCLAEYQTNGQGRFGRKWHSPFAQNIYLSCLYSFKKDISELSGLSLVTSLAVVKSIQECLGLDNIKIKWPNDIMYNDKKLGGILTEIQAEAHGISQAIIGIGINVNSPTDKHHNISTPWTSLRAIMHRYINRNQLCVTLINNFLSYLNTFTAEGLKAFLEEWRHVDYLSNKNATLTIAHHKIQGKVLGINQHGHILLRTNDGTAQAFSSGDAILK